jgi:putative Ca2+/H+ antiporter (TMEM165/GDT1 family)
MSGIFFSSFIVIFLGELGDKTQLAALYFAARYKLSTVLGAIFAASLINNFISVAAGAALFNLFPGALIQKASFVLFIVFGILTLVQKEKSEPQAKTNKIKNPFFIVLIVFIAAEFGDKTQIAAMLMAIQNHSVLPVFLGASLGMFCASLAAVIAGAVLGKKMPINVIKKVSGAAFIAIGLIGLLK